MLRRQFIKFAGLFILPIPQKAETKYDFDPPNIAPDYVENRHTILRDKVLYERYPAEYRYNEDIAFLQQKMSSYQSLYGSKPIILSEDKGHVLVDRPNGKNEWVYRTEFTFCRNQHLANKLIAEKPYLHQWYERPQQWDAPQLSSISSFFGSSMASCCASRSRIFGIVPIP